MTAVFSFGAGESLFDEGDPSSSITFKPGIGQNVLTSIFAKYLETGMTETNILVFTRDGLALLPFTSATNGAFSISVSNSTFVLTNGDDVVYYHASDTVESLAQVTNATPTNIVLDAQLTSAGATGDRVYKMRQAASIPMDGNKVLFEAGELLFTPANSPLHLKIQGGAGVIAGSVRR